MWLYFWANDFPYLSFLTPPCLRRTLQYLSWQLAEPINHKSEKSCYEQLFFRCCFSVGKKEKV